MPMTGRLRFRSAELVIAVLDHVYEADAPVPWSELVETFTSDAHTWKTVEGLLYDLLTFGALHRIGKPGDRRHPDTRALKATDLGRAWLARELLPAPGDA